MKEVLAHGKPPQPEKCPDRIISDQVVARNRLIAGLSDLVIAVEGAPRGGTAHTVRFARRYGKPVVGVRWEGCGGLAGELEAARDPVIDIFNPEGEKRLERMVMQS